MSRIVAAAVLATALALPVAAQAGGSGGDRMPAGGGHMSSYVSDPYHDPRSLHSQRNRTGQLLGAPMFPDMPSAAVSRRNLVEPHWAAGSAPRRVHR